MISLFRPVAALAAVVLSISPPAAALDRVLADHPSPYLSMHADDPVGWQLWNAETVGRARREGKLLFVSSGYFACHWCHVMQRESYRDPMIAELINAIAIPVKVDREVQPALDDHLIRFVQRTRGHAGWPLNVFLTPRGYPLTGFTYLPRDQFASALERLTTIWKRDADSLTEAARQAAASLMPPAVAPAKTLSAADIQERVAGLKQAVLAVGDVLSGGFGRTNKFPMSPQLLALLTLLDSEGDDELESFLRTTLDAMADGELRDHINGGFFRYVTEPDWRIPHFEKMLYDNAQLARVYVLAARVLEEPRYTAVALDTLDFLVSHMAASNGGYIASLSAVDAAGVEGGHYLWSADDLDELLPREELAVASAVWGFGGSSHHHNGDYLPRYDAAPEEVAGRLGMATAEARQRLDNARSILRASRSSHGLPRDDKMISAWNGLALTAFSRAISNGHERYRGAADALARLLRERFWGGAALHRALAGDAIIGTPTLEDYALVALGLIHHARAADDENSGAVSRALVRQAWTRYHTPTGWRLTEDLLVPYGTREAALPDGPNPSPSASLIEASLALSGAEPELARKAREVLERDLSAVREQPLSHATLVAELWAQAIAQPAPIEATDR